MILWSLLPCETAWTASTEPLLINQIAIDPQNPRIVYAAARPQGVLKSMDRGSTWYPAREGLKNTSAYHIVVNPANPNILYLGTFGGGIYKSMDGGENWFEMNQGLGNTNIHALALNPLQPDQLIVSTSTGELFKTKDGGKSWTPFNEGLPFFPGEVIATLLVFPKEPGGLYLAQGGLFKRPFSSPAWQAVEHNLNEQVITAFAYDPRNQTVYAGGMKGGLFKTTLGPNPILAQTPLDWTPIGGPFQGQWIRLIAIDPLIPSVIYVGVRGRGLLKSTDNGSSWKEINTGLPEKEIESLAIDPTDSRILYAGTYSHGIFLSTDGGMTWSLPKDVVVESVGQIITSLMKESRPSRLQDPSLMPPPAFAKCNQCHGWTDPLLNQKSTFWRVPPNIRDWQPTVQRMSRGAGLTPDEEEQIIRFLTGYSSVYLIPAGSSKVIPEKEGPFVIHDIAINPQNPQILYAATSNYGVLKSTDGGVTWGLSNQGIRSYTHHAIVVNPLSPNILYAGAWGGGVSKSVDQGAHWTEINDGLGNTATEDLALDPIKPDRLYVATTSGVFKSLDGGGSWIPFSEGLPVSKIEIFECLLVLPAGSIELFLGTSRGLFKRGRDAPAWEAIDDVMKEQHITALAFHPETGHLYAGTVKNGLLKSHDGERRWTPLAGKIKNAWVSDIALDPLLPEIIYVGTRGNGILKSDDSGITWQEMNIGVPVMEIRSLTMDPKDSKILYAGTTHEGIIKTIDGGKGWAQLTGYPRLSIAEIIASLSNTESLQEDSSPPFVPPEFFKCNQCHGWTDPFLNSKQTYWRVPPNKRDWGPTIHRMGIRAQLIPEEAREIIEFLTTYTQHKR